MMDAAAAFANSSSSNLSKQQQQQQIKSRDVLRRGGAPAAGAGGGGGVGGGGAAAAAAAAAAFATAAGAGGGGGGFSSSGVVSLLRTAKDKVPPLLSDAEIARQDALRVCNPDIDRPFASLEDACERLLPFHVLADFDADENDRFMDSTGTVITRSQLWNDSLTAKINEFRSTLEKQIEAFNSMSKRRADGDMRAEERLMVEQFLLQDEKQKLIDLKVEIEARERAEREAEARMKEAIAQAERVREAQAQAQAEAHARAEAVRMQQVQAEAARMQVHAEVARMQAHAEVVRHAQAEAARMQQAHAETARIQAQGGALRMQVVEQPYQFVSSQMQGEENNTGLESGSQEQDGMVDEMLDDWESLDEDASESNNPDDLFNDDHHHHHQVGDGRGFHDMGLLTSNATMQGEWKEAGTLDLNSLNSR